MPFIEKFEWGTDGSRQIRIGFRHGRRQPARDRECPDPNVSDALRDHDVGQTNAEMERRTPDTGDTIGNHHARQPVPAAAKTIQSTEG